VEEILKEAFGKICKGNFTDDFVYFSKSAFVIFLLCEMYEKGTGDIITKENMDSILNFIEDIKPIMEKMHGGDIGERVVWESLIADVYIPGSKDSVSKDDV